MHNPTEIMMEPAAHEVRPALRIVSLLPAATEIVAALGLADRLVGRSHECDEPASVATLPALTAPRIDAAGTSRQIHDAVGRALAEPPAGSANALYTLDAARLAALNPDLVLTQAACDVCAVATADVRAAVSEMSVPPRVLELSPATLADVYADILTVGAATGTLAKAREVVARLRARVASVACRVRADARQAEACPTVSIIEWLDPPMAAGNWVPELVVLAGGRDLLGTAGAHSHWITWDDVIAADPDVVILVPCGFTLRPRHPPSATGSRCSGRFALAGSTRWTATISSTAPARGSSTRSRCSRNSCTRDCLHSRRRNGLHGSCRTGFSLS